MRVVWVRSQCEWGEWPFQLCAITSFLSLNTLEKIYWRPLYLKLARFWPAKKDPIAKCWNMLQKTLQRKVSENPPQCSRVERRGGRRRPASGRRAVGRRAGPQVSPNRGRTAQVEGDATLFVHHHPRHLCPNHRRQSFPKENTWREVRRTICLIFSWFNSKTIEKTTQQAFWIY